MTQTAEPSLTNTDAHPGAHPGEDRLAPAHAPLHVDTTQAAPFVERHIGPSPAIGVSPGFANSAGSALSQAVRNLSLVKIEFAPATTPP